MRKDGNGSGPWPRVEAWILGIGMVVLAAISLKTAVYLVISVEKEYDG
jgi:hypothetical protein